MARGGDIISSRQNPWFRRLRRALDRHDDEIVLEGPKSVADAIDNGWTPIAVAARSDADCDPTWSPLRFDGALFRALSDTVHSQGIMGLFPRPEGNAVAIIESADRAVVALDGVQDPGNVGTIIRLAAAFDAAGVLLLPGCADLWSPKVLRATTGTIFRVPAAETTTAGMLDAAGRRNLPVVAAAPGSASPGLPSASAFILVLGSEGRGLSEEITAAATPVSIAMSDAVESINVASAAAILLARAFEERGR